MSSVGGGFVVQRGARLSQSRGRTASVEYDWGLSSRHMFYGFIAALGRAAHLCTSCSSRGG